MSALLKRSVHLIVSCRQQLRISKQSGQLLGDVEVRKVAQKERNSPVFFVWAIFGFLLIEMNEMLPLFRQMFNHLLMFVCIGSGRLQRRTHTHSAATFRKQRGNDLLCYYCNIWQRCEPAAYVVPLWWAWRVRANSIIHF